MTGGEPARVAVVGAGAVGLTAGVHLARAGVDAVVFDRGNPLAGVGPGASHRAAGIVYDAYAEDVDVAVAARSLAAFRRLSDVAFTETPYVLFAHEGDEETVDALERSVERMRVHDRDVEVVDPERLETLGLRADDVGVAAVARDAGWVRPRSYLAAMADRLREAGGRLVTGTELSLAGSPPDVVVEGGDVGERGGAFDAIVVAAGAHTRGLLSEIEVAVPVKSYRSQALAVEAAYAGPTWYDATTATYARPHPGGAVVGGGVRPAVATPETWEQSPSVAFVGGARRRFTRRTGLGARPRHAWTGLCTATPDGNPLLGGVAPGVVVATGWYGHGFMRAPATGEAAARATLEGSTTSVLGETGAAAFDPTRFDGEESFRVVFGVQTE